MKIRIGSRVAVSICSAAALLSACGGSQPPIGAPRAIFQHAPLEMRTFRYTGHEQTFTVPRGVTEINVVAEGASGSDPSGFANGGLVKATIAVKPGVRLAVYVGGQGRSSGTGGFNGGGPGGSNNSGTGSGAGGGGPSDIRGQPYGLAERLIVAGGGGGSGEAGVFGYGKGGLGGTGGGKVGGAGADAGYGTKDNGGNGGRQHAGGGGGAGGEPRAPCKGGGKGRRGKLGSGGSGGYCETELYDLPGGGGGGGGYFGGGGGGIGTAYTSGAAGGGGGGGGSSFVEAGATHVKSLRGKAPSGNGEIVISW
ncbi:MAG TPA: hypothetical protein VGI19_00615 [Candidatus Cybelea sp.]